MKTIAVIPVHGREILLPYTIQRLIKKNKVFKVICVGSPNERKVCNDAGALFVEYPNDYLSDKWNEGFEAAKMFEPDNILFVGSSDWVSDNWLEYFEPFTSKIDLIGVRGFHMMDIRNNQLRGCYWGGYESVRSKEPIGIGRIISKRILDKLEWRPFDDKLNSSLDYSMYNNVTMMGGSTALIDTDEVMALSISCGRWGNKHNFEQHWNNNVPGYNTRIIGFENTLNNKFPEYKKFYADLYK